MYGTMKEKDSCQMNNQLTKLITEHLKSCILTGKNNLVANTYRYLRNTVYRNDK